MSAALSFPRDFSASPSSPSASSSSSHAAIVVPCELAALFDESTKAKSTYDRLDERDRRGFVKYIELATTTTARERRAAIVATSLIGLAATLANDARS